MAKFFILLAALCAIVAVSNAQGFGFGGFGGFGMGMAGFGIAGGDLRAVAETAVLKKVEDNTLPADLQDAALQLLVDNESGFQACEKLISTPNTYWQYKRCSVMQLRAVLAGLAAIELEAQARAANTTQTAAA